MPADHGDVGAALDVLHRLDVFVLHGTNGGGFGFQLGAHAGLTSLSR